MSVHLPLGPLLGRSPSSTFTSPRGSTWPVGPSGAPWRKSALARAIGVSPRTIHRWTRGGIPEFAADRAAIALGYHPCEVWGELWWDLDDGWCEVERAWWQWDAQQEAMV